MDIPENMKRLPKTEAYLQHLEEVFYELSRSCTRWDNASDEEKYIIRNPMVHLAETICCEDPEWAADLGKYLCIMCHIKNLDVTIGR